MCMILSGSSLVPNIDMSGSTSMLHVDMSGATSLLRLITLVWYVYEYKAATCTVHVIVRKFPCLRVAENHL